MQRQPSPTMPVRHEPDRATVRKQLERMLADPLFKHSKRYPSLFRFVVERTLDGGNADLKERTLGVAVFGRSPQYDTATDPVVRATAGEIRRRIAQYYQEPGHQHEVRINLSPGSYVPEFSLPENGSAETAPAAPSRRLRYIAIGAVLLTGVIAAFLFTSALGPHTALADFWRPVMDSQSPVLICVGQRRFLGTSPESPNDPSPDLEKVRRGMKDPSAPVSLFQLYYRGSENIGFDDVVTFGQIAGLLQAKGRTYHIRGESSTSLTDLRDGPVILIGAFNNDWTMRLMGPLRFNYERDADTFWIQDRQNPTRRDWAVDYSKPYLKVTDDYAVISRALEPATGRTVVAIGGLTGFGTLAAGEFISNPSYMEAAMHQAPKDWRRKNIQFLITTKVINGGSGPPRVLDKHFW